MQYTNEGRDEYDIAKQKDVASESRMMIGDCIKRLTSAVDDLAEVVDSDEVDPSSSEDAAAAVDAANAMLASSRTILSSHTQ